MKKENKKRGIIKRASYITPSIYLFLLYFDISTSSVSLSLSSPFSLFCNFSSFSLCFCFVSESLFLRKLEILISVASMKKITSAAAKIAVKDEWVAAAMTDDELVVELLLRLKHAGTAVAENPAVNLPPLRWGIRQRRSRSSRFGGGGVPVSLKKDVDSARASPKTPLSWSGGSGSGGCSTSPSAATADGFEDTSRQASCSTSTGSGSKIFPTNEYTSSFSKRLKKKKSSSELKDEEILRLKERLALEKVNILFSKLFVYHGKTLNKSGLFRRRLKVSEQRLINKTYVTRD
ncbi:uncharacterized protein LOC18030259 isoform X2 [Eutrema salsugineum]|uniref:uncharacterized protein LOC18030259 isoform X2 n=1 Tax=Eutrema salsugineum TaxID=72664 RepID=UPI000CED7E93|nr:uncharacterized protein LOC18030259 isoform X2 [Eutrema salsugineum]